MFKTKNQLDIRIMTFVSFRLKSQIPQIKQTLEILRHMQKKKVMFFYLVVYVN